MEKKNPNIKFSTIYNNSSLNELKSTFFPSLTHKELISIQDMKLRTNYDLKAKKINNFHRNFHSEIMKNNLKENSKYSTLYKDSSTYTQTETKFPSLQKGKNQTIIKLNMEPNMINLIMNKSVNKKVKINYKNIFKHNNNISKKYNVSYTSTSGFVSPSIKSLKFSALDKLKSNSVDYNVSLLNITKDDNSLERMVKTQISNNNNSSLSFRNQQNYLNTEIINNNSIDIRNDLNKKFVSSFNPLYASMKKEFLNEFYRKTKDINYLKFISMKNKKDIKIEEEQRASKIERIDQILFTLKTLQSLFDKYHFSKIEYLVYLKKEISNETEKNEDLKEEKLTLMKEIYMIRHKTLRLENRFKNYLDDKFFLLSVKNHSFKLDKFDPDDRDDYKKDLEKMEILNFMLKVTSKDFSETEYDKDKIRVNKLFKKYDIFNNMTLNLKNVPSSKHNSIRMQRRQMTKRKSSKKMVNINNLGYNPLLSVSKKNILPKNFEAKPIYDDVYYFNKDLQETTKKIQDSLDEYNKKSREINMLKQNFFKSKKELKEIREYELHLKDEFILSKEKLENLKKLNNALFNYKKYLQNIFILNLNQGPVFSKINLIENNITNSKDNKVLDFITFKFNDYNTYINTGLDKLELIEGVFDYLITFKAKQKDEQNENYYKIQEKIDKINKKRICKLKQDLIKNKFDSLINKVINKNKKIIFLPRKKAGKDMQVFLKKNKTEKKYNNDDDYFGNFDVF